MDTNSEVPSTALLHINVAAEMLNLTPYMVSKHLLKTGILPHTEIGERTYIPAVALDRYIKGIAS